MASLDSKRTAMILVATIQEIHKILRNIKNLEILLEANSF